MQSFEKIVSTLLSRIRQAEARRRRRPGPGSSPTPGPAPTSLLLPYRCEPTRWGVEEPEPGPAESRESGTARPKLPAPKNPRSA